MKSSLLAKSILISGLITLSFAGYKFLLPQKPKDLCQVQFLKVSQFEIDRKDKDRLGLHMDYSFGKKVNKYLRHVKKARPAFYFKERRKSKPALVSLTTEYKSKKRARSAFKYLKRIWKNNKKGLYDVALNGKEVTWFRNSHSTPQCFFEAVANTKKELGIPEPAVMKAKKKIKKKRKKKAKMALKKKSKKRKKRKYISKK